MRLSFEISSPTPDDDSAEVQVYLDRAGRDYLIAALGKLSASNDHFHMFTEAWGSWELTAEKREPQSRIAHHVKVYLRPEGEPLWSPPQK